MSKIFQIHWNIIGSMVWKLKICLKFLVHQFRQFCDTLKICLKFIMHQLISLVSRLDPPCFLVEEPGYEVVSCPDPFGHETRYEANAEGKIRQVRGPGTWL